MPELVQQKSSRLKGTQSWYTSLMQEQFKRSSETKRREDLLKCRTVQEEIKCRVQVWCSSEEPNCFSEKHEEFEIRYQLVMVKPGGREEQDQLSSGAANKSKLESQQKQFARSRETSWEWSKSGEQAQ
ncbi:nudix hydrolase 2-like [Dorcoceras hygrometricum]|uniref:Nudix hydrolase 2-like n=1 Tax=Dorcoceras hygrometricum TaxID=472368 RepID=A0A2Z7ASB0_9LAMI|nr:nudix hydrolase 2-like [Dorcoceras hygrometricum]